MTPLNGQQMNALLHYIGGGLQMLKIVLNWGLQTDLQSPESDVFSIMRTLQINGVE